MENSNLISFEGKEIRKAWHDEQWYFSVVDVIEILSDSPLPRQYWNKVKKSITTESQTYPFWIQLKMTATDGRSRLTDCANTEGVLRIAMSVPSPKAEPLRLWLAEQGKRTIDETENPELLTQRQFELYKAKGYPDEWITKRIQTIDTRKQLTDEWKKRNVKEDKEYSILTSTIAKGTFGVTPSEHKKLKGLEKPSQILRDHMTPMELILTALGEEATRMIAVEKDAQGFEDNHDAAVKGGKIGNKALKNVERETGKKVVSKDNYLKPPKATGELPESPIEPKE
jgi:DNA-damage-inducible protein D